MLEQWLKRKTIGAARRTLRPVNWIRQGWRGHRYQKRWDASEQDASGIAGNAANASNPLRNYVRSKEVGPGIWKWDHYLDIYNRHFEKFRGKEVNVLEIGVYSGGSIEMWREYFGPRCRVYGVDWDPSCRVYESESVRIFIGDQADRQFWRQFKEQVPYVDVIVDDGGHESWQQIATLEEMLPHLRPGGVYICEDVVGVGNTFLFYIDVLTHSLYGGRLQNNFGRKERRSFVKSSGFQSMIHSVHSYPFVVVIEKHDSPVAEFFSSMKGTIWQPSAGIAGATPPQHH